MTRVVKKPFERKSEIIAAARDLFQVKGYESVPLVEIMNCLKIAKGTIYHYFKSKEDLLEAVIKEIVQEHILKMQSLVEKSKGNALQKIKFLIEEGRKLSQPALLDELHKKGNEAMHTRLMVATLMKQAPLYAKLIHQGCEEGIFETNNPLESAEFILSAVQFLTDMGIHAWTQDDLERRAKAFPKILEKQLNAPVGSFAFMGE